MRQFLFLVCYIVVVAVVQAQTTSKEISFRFAGADSVLLYQKERRIDAQGALTYKKEYFYNGVANQNALWREESAVLSDNILTQTNTYYTPNTEPTTEKLETKYLRYAADDDSCKIIWVRKYDNIGELVKEDTCTYNKKGYLSQKCSYVFTGSTSLVCEVYRYDKKGNRRRTKIYSHWNTVNMRGRADSKKSLRANYKFKYNSRQQITKGKGKIFKAKYNEIHLYDKKGLPTLEEKTLLREQKISEEDRKKNNLKQKFIEVKDQTRTTYLDGRMLEDILIEGNNKKRHQINSYQDTLLVTTVYKGKNDVVIEKITHNYSPQAKLQTKVKEKYDEQGILRYTINYEYDAQGNLVRETQTSNGRSISTYEYTYDAQNRMISKILYNAAGMRVELTLISYS
jgi:YD repeat-containing protein